jgi:hypothetical protein
MANYTTEIVSTLSPSDAFTYMAEFQNVASWDPGVKHAEKLTEGPATLGSEFKVVTVTNGRELPIVYRIVEFEEGVRVVLKGETSRLRSLDEISVASRDGGSLVTYSANLSLLGGVAFLSPLLGPTLRKIGNRARDQLRISLN